VRSGPRRFLLIEIPEGIFSSLSNARLFFQEFVHLDLKENDDRIINLFQKVYTEQREPVFQKRIRTILDMRNSLGPVPRSQRILSRPELKELFNGNEEGNLYTRNRITVIRDAFKLYDKFPA